MLYAIEAIIDEQSQVHWLENIRLEKSRRVLIILLPDEKSSEKYSGNAKEILQQTDFIGCGEASSDFSEQYKTELFKNIVYDFKY